MIAEEVPYRERPRRDVLSFMAALSLKVCEHRMAEGYMLELLAFCAFNVSPEGDDHARA